MLPSRRDAEGLGKKGLGTDYATGHAFFALPGGDSAAAGVGARYGELRAGPAADVPMGVNV